jgi:hypothetical protein
MQIHLRRKMNACVKWPKSFSRLISTLKN